MYAVIGAGMGGLTSAIQLARQGRDVTVFEATNQPGGLAGRVDLGGHAMDGGPYILLDRPGLEWSFAQMGESLSDHINLIPLDETWRVCWPNGQEVRVYRSLEQTAQELEHAYPGSAKRYIRYVQQMTKTYERLAAFQRSKPPKPWRLLHPKRIGAVPFLLRPLGHHLAATGLPEKVQHALGIWTHIASQPLAKAPAPLAFVPAIVHSVGAFVAKGGVHTIPEALHRIAEKAGVQFRFNTRVTRIDRKGNRVTHIVAGDQHIAVDGVVSNAPGIGTLTELVQPPDPALNRELQALPLQSPGVAVYMTGDSHPHVPFLRFMLKPDEPCRLFIRFDGVDPSRPRQLRLLCPTDHTWAQAAGREGQTDYLNTVIGEDWWRAGTSNIETLGTRIPLEWGRRHHLYRDSMNPVMTAKYMRRGRLPHSPSLASNLHLAGSATHPGQWVSFAAISGILAANAITAGE